MRAATYFHVIVLKWPMLIPATIWPDRALPVSSRTFARKKIDRSAFFQMYGFGDDPKTVAIYSSSDLSCRRDKEGPRTRFLIGFLRPATAQKGRPCSRERYYISF